MKNTLKKAALATIPVMAGYLVLGFGFGLIMSANGYSTFLTFAMSLLIYAGAMQYVAIDLFASGASLLTTAITTLMVNARHLFYGISMLDKYKNTGLKKLYLAFALTDETYSLVCSNTEALTEQERIDYCFLVTLFDHIYWVTGSVLGAAAGTLLHFDTTGIDFALTALFITVFIEQWLGRKNHTPAIIGILASVICVIIFGADRFLIPAMLLITIALCLHKEDPANE